MKLTQQVFREYSKELHWNVPFFLNNDRVARELLTTSFILFNKKPFDSIYGGFTSPWSGGRGSVRSDVIDLGSIPNMIDFNNMGVKVWLTFSRYSMTEEAIEDKRMWRLVDWMKANQVDVGFIVSNDTLMKRLKRYYPDAPIKMSIIKTTMEALNLSLREETEWYLKQFDKGYDFIVPRSEYIINGGYDYLPEKVRPNIEIMVNQFCTYECPKAKAHYEAIEKFESTGEWGGFVCNSRKSLLETGNNVCIDYKSINKLVDVGYTHYKLQGRGLSARCALEQVSAYIFEPTGAIHILSEEIINNIKRDSEQGIPARF